MFSINKFRMPAITLLLGMAVTAAPAKGGGDEFTLRFVDAKEAAAMLSTPDGNTDRWSRFDIEARTGRKGATRAELLGEIRACTRDFTAADKDTLRKAFGLFHDKLAEKGLKLPLPDELVLVKTTMREEGGADAYTRENIICIGEGVLGRHTAKELAYLAAHETFHVLTRENPGLRKAMYGVIGFGVLDEEISFADDVTERRISNPDVNRYDSYAMLTVDGVRRPYTMLIYSDRDYAGGSLFDYVNIGLVPLDGSFKPVRKDGRTVIVPLERAEDFYSQVGRNTGYVINPEECLADNFAYAVCDVKKDLPDPWVTQRILSVIRNYEDNQE